MKYSFDVLKTKKYNKIIRDIHSTEMNVYVIKKDTFIYLRAEFIKIKIKHDLNTIINI